MELCRSTHAENKRSMKHLHSRPSRVGNNKVCHAVCSYSHVCDITRTSKHLPQNKSPAQAILMNTRTRVPLHWFGVHIAATVSHESITAWGYHAISASPFRLSDSGAQEQILIFSPHSAYISRRPTVTFYLDHHISLLHHHEVLPFQPSGSIPYFNPFHKLQFNQIGEHHG